MSVEAVTGYLYEEINNTVTRNGHMTEMLYAHDYLLSHWSLQSVAINIT